MEARALAGSMGPKALWTDQLAAGTAWRPSSTIAGEASVASTFTPCASKAAVRKPVPAPSSVTRAPRRNGANAARASAKRFWGAAWAS